MFRKRLIIAIFISLLTLPLFAKGEYYDAGSQRFVISAGVDFPFFVTDFENNRTGFWGGEDGTHLFAVGGYGSITYQMFANSYFALGGEIGYMFNYSVSDELLTNVPIQFKVSYVPVQGQIDIPISLGLGFSYLSYNEGALLCPYVTAEIGLDFYFNEHWGAGIETGLWLVPELYTSSSRSGYNGMGGFIPLLARVIYRQ